MGQMDLDTYEMSRERRAFTVERIDMNANAPGRLSPPSQIRDCVSLSFFLRLRSFSIRFFLLGFTLLSHPPCVCVCECVCVCVASRYWLLRVTYPSLFTSPL